MSPKGLNYLGITHKDPYKYGGSGVEAKYFNLDYIPGNQGLATSLNGQGTATKISTSAIKK